MKRWMIRIILCLILGAITTVAVAWGCVLWLPPRPAGHAFTMQVRSIASDEAANLLRRFFPNETIKADDSSGWIESRFGWLAVGAGCYVEETDQYVRVDLEVTRAGWPARALSGSWCRSESGDFDGETLVESIAFSGAMTLPESWQKHRGGYGFLPYHPIWLGFVTNTIFYPAAWFAIAFAFTSAKKFIRAKRGRCPRCGYDLRGNLSAGCSECGWNREEQVA